MVRKICKDLQLGEKSQFIGRIFLLVTVAAICTLPALDQEAPMGTGVLGRNLEVRPLTCTFSPNGSQLACGSWGNGAVESITILDGRRRKR